MLLSSPRAKAGFRILAASMAPSPAPAPTSVWISSMNRITRPSLFVTSLITLFNRSSNSPLYFAPATKAPMSSENTCLSFRFSGTSPRTIRWARPSTMAVLPVPGSPIRIGLFLVRRERIWRRRRISSSRPITGSSFPALASSTRFFAYLLRLWKFSSPLMLCTFCPWRSSCTAFITSLLFMPASFKIRLAVEFTSKSANRIGSMLTNSSPSCFE